MVIGHFANSKPLNERKRRMKIEATAQVPEKKDAQGKVVQKALGPATVFVEVPDSASDAIKSGWCTDEAVWSNACAHFKVSPLQSNIRSGLKAGKTQDQLQAELGSTKMGVAVKGQKVDYRQAFLAEFKSATPERQAEMIKMLRDEAAGAPASK
jgi:hypothetical protein